MNRPLIVWTTTATQAEALHIAQQLVANKLAACVQIEGPIQSLYRWNDQVETAEEWRCVIKTVEHRYPELESAIVNLHSYDVPQIVATEIAAGSQAYLGWLRDNTT